jgi:LysM repeat protein
VQSPRWLIVASSALLLAALVIVAGCGGSKDKASVSNRNGVATATLPNPLPNPVIVGAAHVPGRTTTYTVLDGDTLGSIAAQFDISVDDLAAANSITDPTALSVGQVLTIPGVSTPSASTPEPTSAPAPTEAPPNTPAAGQQTYTVLEGDIPETIAAQFGITADALLAANGITDATSLQIGQVLIIPAPQ